MKKIMFLLALCSIFYACSKKADPNSIGPPIETGSYSGTFQRQTLTSSNVALVNLEFAADGTWTGSSQTEYYPALCNGTYQFRGSMVSFDNKCTWPANFDWSYILDGDFEVSSYNDTLVLTKSQGNSTIDIYKLKKL